jgi:hypothetical protein
MVDLTEVELPLDTTRASRSWRAPILPDPLPSSLAEGEHGEGERQLRLLTISMRLSK